MKNLYFITIAIIAVVMAFNFNVEAQQKEAKKAIPLAGVGALNTEIEFPVGNLRVNTTSGRTTKCVFQFRKDEWEPEIQYNKERGEGYLKITSEGDVDFHFDDDRRSGYEEEDQATGASFFLQKYPMSRILRWWQAMPKLTSRIPGSKISNSP